ncbi:MAG: TIGR04255 family protein [Opitutales bacterium]
MSDFPIRDLKPLPVRISPCPILKAVLELRFVTTEDWSVLPGLLFGFLRGRYPHNQPLSLAEMPKDVRQADRAFTYKPLIQFENDQFVIHFGPRMLSLSTKGNYPGWTYLREEMSWLLDAVKAAGFIAEGERLGLRYVDFFEEDLFKILAVKVFFNETHVVGPELSITKILHYEKFRARLLMNDSVTVQSDQMVRKGGIFDLDVWLGPQDFQLFEDGLDRFDDAHRLSKKVFFGLLEPSFLEKLNPQYE